MSVEVRLFIGGAWRDTDDAAEVVDPYRGTTASTVYRPAPSDVDDAIAGAADGAATMAALPAHRRAAILRSVASAMDADPDRFATRIVYDCGKCIRDARGEIARAVEVLQLSAEEATRIQGNVISLDALPAGEGNRLGLAMRFPVGVIAAIAPFNAPVQVLCHKVGPAFAAGNAVICLPARQGSASAAELLRLFLEAGLPPDAFQLLPAGGETVGDYVVSHPGVDMIAFTGSGRTGERIVKTAGLKRTLLELSGNAGVAIHADADWEAAVNECVPAAYGISGQSCVSLQRLYVQRERFDDVTERFTTMTSQLRTGDTLSEDTTIGAMISHEAAERVEQWVQEAVDFGAQIRTGGTRQGTVMEPTVLTDVTSSMKVVCDEVFGPVVSLIPYDDLDEVLEMINDSPWGLAAGVFTRSLDVAMQAARQIRAGVVNINGPSRYRVEHMPYGGVKASGWGKEGPRYSIEDMTEVRMITFSQS